METVEERLKRVEGEIQADQVRQQQELEKRLKEKKAEDGK